MKQADHLKFMAEAVKEARKGLREGGIPIGSVLVKNGKVIGRGHNRRVQKKSAILHAEMDCLENAGRLRAEDYKDCVIYSTLSPCDMCTGAILLYKIPVIVIGENGSFKGPEAYSKKRGVKLINLDLAECRDMMLDFIADKSRLWNEDIGE
jgi:cytosine deaminase